MLLGTPLPTAFLGLLVLVLFVMAGAVLVITLATAVVLGLVAPTDLPGGWALGGGLGATSQQSDAAMAAIPPDQLAAMRDAAANAPCPLDWSVLAGIARVESGFGKNMATSSAGAIGYGQFLPTTWAMPGIGNGGNPYDYHDALPAMARYLCQAGAGHDVRQALYAYNHADWYVSEVLDYANQYATAAAPTSGPPIATPLVDFARSWVGTTPYLFGGCSRAGIDCSCLVQLVYAQFGIGLPRTAAEQFGSVLHIDPSQLQPGDLVFFSNTYLPGISHVGIYEGGGLMINAADEHVGVAELPVFTGYWGAHFTGAGRVRT
jgi:cell wall-associated NlpC family hydrolase